MRSVNAPSPHAVPGRAARLAVPAGLLAAVTAAFAYVAAVDPNEPGHYPVCPLLGLTGLYCPGCGGLRSAHAVAHGDLAAALQANAPAVLGYAAFAVLWTVWVIRAARGRPVRLDPPPAVLWTAGGLLLAFTVLRNTPFGGWLHP
ncbi:DUF2752 domain-containing protein [Streptomyces althioticus]|uniref:Membrane protein n=1 Tax=Streptomyces griseorubens TaxID=66897 RepID=A0ABR4T5L8_9ACTN|nr:MULTISPECIES: DUF2752 domain-containing protein [Streptomyces]KEG42754.1 membrane protein [Streptomyces griseorubens]MBM4831406.1 DUF2752 domain-containing protein [Actinospica acidiphila]WTC25726.1 DUF2752 domain-containing protein [Streptomyces althioticus]GGQ43309.1 membrane protein [Streptomyces althioticus]